MPSAHGLPIRGGVDADKNADAEERGERDNEYSPHQVVHFWDLISSSGSDSTAGPDFGSYRLYRGGFTQRRGTPE